MIFHLSVGRSHDRPSTLLHSGTDIFSESWSLSRLRTKFLCKKYMMICSSRDIQIKHLPLGWNSAQRTACTSSRVVTLMNLGLPESSVMVSVFTFSSTGGAGLLVAAVFCLWYSLTSLVFCLSSSAVSAVGPASSAAGAPPDLNTSSPFLKR